MSQYQTLKTQIQENINQNGEGAIRGDILQTQLLDMINALGAGYQFIGVATPTNPGTAQTPDYKCFYIATTPGTYTNLGGLVVNDGEVAILKYDSTWHKDVTGAATASQLSELSEEFQQLGVVTYVDNVDNFPNGVVCFTSVNPPSGLPNWVSYGGGAMIITIRQNNDTLTEYDKQFLVTPGDMPASRTYFQGVWLDWVNSSKPQFIQDQLNPPAIDNLPNGVRCFTSASVPQGYPQIDYAGGAIIITIRQNNDTLQNFDRQYVINSEYFCERVYWTGGWQEWSITQLMSTSGQPQFIQDQLNPPAIDNLPNGVRCFTSASVPQGYPQIDYAGGAIIITIRQNNDTLQNFDRQYVINSEYFCERAYWTGGWQEWSITQLNAVGRTITCGVGKDFSRLRDAVGEAINSPNNTVIVYPGVYDLAEEFSEEIANHSGSGIALRNNIHLYFMPGAYVKCLIDVSNDWAESHFEPFWVNSTLGSDFTIENMNIVAKNCRYCVHDEHYGKQSYHHRYINCQMDMTSEHETPHYVQCIGGGLGEHGYIEIIGGVYSSHATHGGDSSQIGISYHNGDNVNADSKIVIKDVYLKDKGYIRFGAYGPSEKASKALVCGCSFGQPIANIQEISGGSATLFDLLEWNNELRTQ